MEELQAKHRKQQRDLQAQVTQKKKAASKKTRKSVNDECARLEQDLKEKQAAEVQAITNGSVESDKAAPLEDSLLDSIVDSARDPRQDSQQANGTPDGDEAPQQRRPNRQKARLARRAAEQQLASEQAAEEAANLPDLKAEERKRLLEAVEKQGLVEKEVAANGHCLYLSVADQIKQLDLKAESAPNFKEVRAAAADYIAQNPDDFEPFLEEPLDLYVRKIRDTGEWGGQLELLALAKSYGIDINVMQGRGEVVKIESGAEPSRGSAWLAYYRHGFGLGEHYNSLRKKAT